MAGRELTQSSSYRPTHGMSIVYKATNALNLDFYIGLTCQYLCQRRSKHRALALNKNSPTHFHRAIRKYGWESFSFEVVAEFKNYDDAKAEEIRLIAELRPAYNMTKGGDGSVGYKHTPEMCKEFSRRNTGRPGFWKGKKLPPHVVEMMRARGKKNPNKERILKCGPKSIRRAVVCLDDGAEYESIAAAAMHYGVNSSQVSQVCGKNPIRVSAGGLVFRFKGEHFGGKTEADAVRLASRKRRFTRKKPHYMRPVVCLDDKLTFPTVKDAALHYGVSKDRVRKSCKARYKYKACEKLSFKYASDVSLRVTL